VLRDVAGTSLLISQSGSPLPVSRTLAPRVNLGRCGNSYRRGACRFLSARPRVSVQITVGSEVRRGALGDFYARSKRVKILTQCCRRDPAAVINQDEAPNC
ncbi:hypothetical protein chiPu_0028515, partial [Chiloscyllium punctatum]|nr:hypothetical protein [Chiloscyllium punctatum]